MPSTDYLPFAVGTGSNVEAQTDYAGSTHQTQGFTTGKAESAKANKVWRQSSMMSAAWANAIMSILSQNVPDDGNLSTLVAQILVALQTVAQNQAKPQLVSVPFSVNPTFDCFAGNAMHPVFEITLTGNVTSSTIINLTPGQLITFHIIQDSVGGHTFTPPVSIPLAGINGTPAQINTQSFAVRSTGSVVAVSAMHMTQ